VLPAERTSSSVKLFDDAVVERLARDRARAEAAASRRHSYRASVRIVRRGDAGDRRLASRLLATVRGGKCPRDEYTFWPRRRLLALVGAVCLRSGTHVTAADPGLKSCESGLFEN
jgi:hypothetical protein